MTRAAALLRRAGEGALDLLFPPSLYCICCGNLIDRTRTYSLCDHCMDHIRWNADPPEIRAGMPFLRCMDYGIYERSIIFSLKYNGRRYIAREAAKIMADRLVAAGIKADILVPVPLHPEKERARGFNQAALMAKYLAPLISAESVPDCLVRTRKTRPMRGLGPEERMSNIAGSIALREGYEGFAKGKRIVLIDDFSTTGSTGRACGDALRAAEPAEVVFLAFAAREKTDVEFEPGGTQV